MIFSKDKKSFSAEEVIKQLIRLVCYISLPLIALFALTIGMSLLSTGGINTNVNESNNFMDVFMSFSLPMVIALAVVPLLVKIKVQKKTFTQLGLDFPKSRLNLIFCVAMIICSVAMAIILSGEEGLNISPWIILTHFLFVAVSEEIILRSVILDELRFFSDNIWVLSLMNGVIFAFVYHSNDGFLPNLLVRVPLGFVLCFIRIKSKNVYTAIGLHWAYNMFVTTI